MKIKNKLAAVALLLLAQTIAAQTYPNIIFFGDSATDSGYFKYRLDYSTTPASYATYGGFTTNPDGTWANILGRRFGVTVTPSDAPGGGNNYAIGGARVSYNYNAGNPQSAADQVRAYLASVGNVANPNALYSVFIGLNDLQSTTSGGPGNIVNPQNTSALTTLANQTSSLVVSLYSAGARNFLVPNMLSSPSAAVAAMAGQSYSANTSASRNYYSQTVWNGIASRGINFIPADISTVMYFVVQNPTQFGISNVSKLTPACGAVLAQNCGPANLVTPNANQTYLWADTGGHWSYAGQRIEADYFYGLMVAPGQVSMLASQASLSQTLNNQSYLDQVGYSFRAKAPQTLGAWAAGSAQQVNISGTPTATSSSPYNGAAGMDYQYSESLLLGGYVGYGQAQVNYNTSGNFTQSASTLGAYAGYKNNSIWVNGIASYTWLNNNVNRVTPIGITSFSNTSSVNGSNQSVAAQTGYDFDFSSVTHGPLLGYAYVRTDINGFTESGNFNSLQFGSQTINSSIGSAGYQAQAKLGSWLPYAKAVYSSQLGNTDRSIMTTLTTVTAPSYSMPAVSYGKNWTDLTAGIGYQIDPKTVIRTTFTQRVGQQSVNSYNAVVSMNAHF